MKRFLVLIGLAGVLFTTTPWHPSVAAQQPPGAPIEGFEAVEQVPPSEQLPAAPLLVSAYAFAWLAVFFYLWTVWRRLNKVEADMHALEKRSKTR